MAEIDPLGIMENELKEKIDSDLSVQIHEKSEKQNILREVVVRQHLHVLGEL